MRYVDFLWAIDLLSRCYPRYQVNELLTLADDVWKWINNELPDDSSALIYLKTYFNSPHEAVRAVWKELQLLLGPFHNIN